MVEIEIKIKVDDPAAARSALLRAGASLEKERQAEDDTFYDFRSRILSQKACALRLRRRGKKTFLTFKGAPQKSRSFKVRPEFETEVKNEKHARRILRGLGMIPTFRYQKFRTVFRTNKLRISLDETPVGTYLELEGERSDIARFARQMGFARSLWIKLDYVKLLEKAGRKNQELSSVSSSSSSSSPSRGSNSSSSSTSET